jgi:hypothetical protein
LRSENERGFDQVKTRVAELVLLIAIAGVASGCVPQRMTTGAFTEVGRLETDLRRGISTKADVERVLGPAKGAGGAILPSSPDPRDVWFYQDIEVTDITLEGGSPVQVVRVKMRQQILLVFFDKGLFDGFMWYSNDVPGLGLAK